MFGDSTDQTNTDSGVTTDDAAAMGTPAPSAPDMSFPAVPSADGGMSAPADTSLSTPSDVPALDTSTLVTDDSVVTPTEDTTTPTIEPAAPAELLSSDDMSQADDTPVVDSPEESSTEDTVEDTSSDDSSTDTTESAPSSLGNDELMSIKQQALQDLTPLVDKLDQPAEDQFRTLMRLIQASDNPDLIKQAFDSAQKITDDKERAQALLDVINEINYFSNKTAA